MVVDILDLEAKEILSFLNSSSAFAVTASICGYLLGSISFSVIFTKKPLLANNQDIRNIGSKNAGFTNVLRSVGKKPAILTFVFDFLKGLIATFMGQLIFSFISKDVAFCGAYLSGFFCILGHIFPCFFEFAGGKAVLTSAAVILFIDYRVFLTIVSVFLLTFALTRIVSLSSLLAALFYPLSVVFVFKSDILAMILSFAISSLVIFKHKENLKRILKGQEKKISIKK